MDKWVEVGSDEWRSRLPRPPWLRRNWKRLAGGAVFFFLFVANGWRSEERQVRHRAEMMVKLGEITALAELAASQGGSQ